MRRYLQRHHLTSVSALRGTLQLPVVNTMATLEVD